jgi:hypothetical protein
MQINAVGVNWESRRFWDKTSNQFLVLGSQLVLLTTDD